MAIKRKVEEDDIEPKAKSLRSSEPRNNDAISPPSQPQPPLTARPSSSVASRSSHSSSSVIALTNREKRQYKYKESMAILNYQLYCIAKRALASPISRTGSYTHLVDTYQQQAAYLKRLYCKTYGDVAVFGIGDCGQLGCGQGIDESYSPRVVVGLRGMEVGALALGGLHTLVLTERGEVYSFGCNDEGALGGIVVDEGFQPCKVEGFVPSAFGPNGAGLSSRDVVTFEERERQVGLANIVQIVAGETTSLALSEDGDVYMWGSYRDKEGRAFRHLPPPDDDRVPTGRKDMSQLSPDESVDMYMPPRGAQDWPLHLCLDKKAKDISAGDGWGAAILEDETIVTWGVGTSGEMAREVPVLDKKTPMKVVISEFLTPKPPTWNGLSGKKKVAAISCGAYHLLAIVRECGMNVYGSGLNQYGQLGLGDNVNRNKLTKIEFFEGRSIVKCEGGAHFSCFVNNTGKELYCCGRGDYGQLGISLEQPESGSFETTPIRVPLVYTIQKSKVTDPKGNCIIESDIVEEDQPEIEQISCGSSHVLVLTKDGDVYSWGFAEFGACGQGKRDTDIMRPKKMEAKLANAQGAKYKIKFVCGGGQHSAMVVSTDSRESGGES
ncbi:hypothetical protein HJC23_002860 [Cyclotella cryptica]|uniref:RCC1-like domain-containing protein n=1 Tax=Cyclotella cryptica TaxID=29204 RepID=A0ABD3PLU8_9STRA|eukprot:CCRYP_013806-RA/>CCRYP_013806-RA protein AED:0.02 eAED:0.02 QI:424/1/1/1/1/1/2/46/608